MCLFTICYDVMCLTLIFKIRIMCMLTICSDLLCIFFFDMNGVIVLYALMSIKLYILDMIGVNAHIALMNINHAIHILEINAKMYFETIPIKYFLPLVINVWFVSEGYVKKSSSNY